MRVQHRFFHYIALLIALTSIAGARAANVNCPVEAVRGPDDVPYPTITSLTVLNADVSENVRARMINTRDAEVIAGDADHGSLRVDIVLSEAVPSNCILRLSVNRPGSNEATGAESEAASLRTLLQESAIQQLLAAHTAGDNRISMLLETRLRPTGSGNQTYRLQLKLVSSGAAVPFSVTAKRIQPLTGTVDRSEVAPGAEAELLLTLNQDVFRSEILARPVHLTVEPAGAGTLRTAGSPTYAASQDQSLDANIVPPRLRVYFRPSGGNTAPANVTVRAELGGNSIGLPIRALPGPEACRWGANLVAVAGGFEATIRNLGDTPCPQFTAEFDILAVGRRAISGPALVADGTAGGATVRRGPPQPNAAPSRATLAAGVTNPVVITEPLSVARLPAGTVSGVTGNVETAILFFDVTSPNSLAGKTATLVLVPNDHSFSPVRFQFPAVSGISIPKRAN